MRTYYTSCLMMRRYGADSIRAIVRRRAAVVDGIAGRIGGHSLRGGSERVRWLRCVPGHEEGQGDGDDTTSIHSGVQGTGSDGSVAR